MLSLLPDTGVRGAAQVCLMKQFITILKSARHTDEKALSMLALRSFMHDQEGLFNLTLYIKDILKTLRELKKSSILAYEMLKLLSDGHDSSIKELMQVDCSANGEVISVICFKNMIFSGHLDGMIKVWKGGENLLSLLQETHEHSKAVTSLAIVKSGDKLYSGALDKTIRGKLCCGCNDSSIQEIDWATETSVTIHPGKKKLLGKETPIYAVQLRDGLLFSAGMFVDGVAVKVRQRTLFVDGVAGMFGKKNSFKTVIIENALSIY
ncbi:putative E3 ubiquitin-protein ligase LIN-1 [Zingiber officinale]|uniref:putative E3 ubiquitin-protein ligase LIN-1 n=1 Tax=Zingiber officinale TaxID=94328 RepID=UPI001C4DBEF9|nr:putative E3 ubiquitin-protein ligase LIN-1 [Zingiber officinale]